MASTLQAVSLPATAGRDTGDRRPALLILPALIVLAVFFLYPLVSMAISAFTDPTPGFGNFSWFFGEPQNLKVLGRTFTTGLWVTVIALVVSYPYAYAMTIAGPRVRAVLTLLVLVPFWTSLMVRTFAWVILLQDTGVINGALQAIGLGPFDLIRTQTGVVIGMVQLLMPFMVLPLYAVMSGIDRRLLTAAGSLGAHPIKAFVKVYLPLSLPGVSAGCLTVFISALGFYVTPALLGSPTDALISQQIFTQVNGLLKWGRGGAMGVVLLGLTLAMIALLALTLRRTGRKVTG
ncbi:putative spermidine/putrescine transport system permease protein [Nonomuraea solani]|uniref:Putative spermidine/putrescine transport system permease protein n=1 Tax=Nonomuraea solani TaxID=1144553 RepID=A0A1H6F2J4_9ACTN|nr:putative spermidine/putrescine transport system permease protein [Nonomuraea solani]